MRRETIYVPAHAAPSPSDDEFHLDSEESDSRRSVDGSEDIERELEDKLKLEPIPQTRQERILAGLQYALPHIGLVFLLFFYLIIGATLFHYIEAPNELRTKDHELRTIFGLRDEFAENIWNLTHSTDTVISRESFNGICQEYFDKLITNTFMAYRNQFINERHLLNRTRGDEMMWTYANSIFFSTTVITTIGYGHLVPATQVGRIACICFALFGIPLLLVTIADIGKFLSDFLTFLYRTYMLFKTKVRKQSRRISLHYRSRTTSRSERSEESAAGSMNLPDDTLMTEDEEQNDERDLHIPVFMVLLVLVAYTGLGALLFQEMEGWSYFDAFYFCFITMATVGFGDFVPTEQVYVIFTMAYIIFGLSLATMCIDLAGTAYLKRIHDLGKKMHDAKGVVLTGLHEGEHLFKHMSLEVIRKSGRYRLQAELNAQQVRELGLWGRELIITERQQRNILYEPLSPIMERVAKQHNIKIMANEISDDEGSVFKNDYYGKMPKRLKYMQVSPNAIHRILRPKQKDSGGVVLVPFVLKESDI